MSGRKLRIVTTLLCIFLVLESGPCTSASEEGSIVFPASWPSLPEFPALTVRRYLGQGEVDGCCGMVEGELAGCLDSMSDIFSSLNEFVSQNEGRPQVVGVVMMTSARVRSAYSAYSEAATARWAQRWADGPRGDAESGAEPGVEFLVVEVEDGAASYGAAETSASELGGHRVPHWQKARRPTYIR